MGRSLSGNEQLKAFKLIHGNKYDYSKSIFINDKEKVEIICNKHKSFFQSPAKHKQGQGCPKCAIETLAKNNIMERKENLKDFKAVHGNKYDYSLVPNIFKTKKVIPIICREHGIFYQLPKQHKIGQGCPSCSKTGFNVDAPAMLYYLKVNNHGQILYKIGITNLDVNQRYPSKDLKKITILLEQMFENGKSALRMEQKILNKYKVFKYIGEPVLKRGNTELFTEDVLNLDIT